MRAVREEEFRSLNARDLVSCEFSLSPRIQESRDDEHKHSGDGKRRRRIRQRDFIIETALLVKSLSRHGFVEYL